MSNTPQSLYERRRYFAMALDPIHVGTGGYRLGRVDMSIVREPGTNLPKIPGTSLVGACRTFAAMQEDGKFPQCAGQSGHCGDSECPICVTFGFVGDKQSFQGLAQLSDARLVLFPVHSLAGPVWVTCPDVLRELDAWNPSFREPADSEVTVSTPVHVGDCLNLGWLMLTKTSERFTLDSELPDVPAEIRNRSVLISNKLFGHIVNDNLEVRTSVSIDPATGAAAEGALFTYEALPRSTILAFDLVVSNPEHYRIGSEKPLAKSGGKEKVLSTVEAGLGLFEALGVGGMSTRGMGRLRVLNLQGETKAQSPVHLQSQAKATEAKR
jgi:CRISPR-associated protein Cmr4